MLLFPVYQHPDKPSALPLPKKISKTYFVKVKGVLEEEELEKLRKGIKLADGITAPAKAKRIRKTESNSWLEITIHEGKKL